MFFETAKMFDEQGKSENKNFNAHVANRSAVFILLATKYNTHNVNIAQF